MAADLLKKGHTSAKWMWLEKEVSTYDAVVVLNDTGGRYVNFKLEFPKRKDGTHGKSKPEVSFIEQLKPLLPADGDASEPGGSGPGACRTFLGGSQPPGYCLGVDLSPDYPEAWYSQSGNAGLVLSVYTYGHRVPG